MQEEKDGKLRRRCRCRCRWSGQPDDLSEPDTATLIREILHILLTIVLTCTPLLSLKPSPSSSRLSSSSSCSHTYYVQNCTITGPSYAILVCIYQRCCE